MVIFIFTKFSLSKKTASVPNKITTAEENKFTLLIGICNILAKHKQIQVLTTKTKLAKMIGLENGIRALKYSLNLKDKKNKIVGKRSKKNCTKPAFLTLKPILALLTFL